jgi:hypothetical protein
MITDSLVIIMRRRRRLPPGRRGAPGRRRPASAGRPARGPGPGRLDWPLSQAGSRVTGIKMNNTTPVTKLWHTVGRPPAGPTGPLANFNFQVPVRPVPHWPPGRSSRSESCHVDLRLRVHCPWQTLRNGFRVKACRVTRKARRSGTISSDSHQLVPDA